MSKSVKDKIFCKFKIEIVRLTDTFYLELGNYIHIWNIRFDIKEEIRELRNEQECKKTSYLS